MHMNLISRDELKTKLDRHEDFKLVMVLGEWAFKAKHIPGSLNVYTDEQANELLGKQDDIVVYCSNEACPASIIACRRLESQGYTHVRRYAGGLADWEDSHLPLEGDMMD